MAQRDPLRCRTNSAGNRRKTDIALSHRAAGFMGTRPHTTLVLESANEECGIGRFNLRRAFFLRRTGFHNVEPFDLLDQKERSDDGSDRLVLKRDVFLRCLELYCANIEADMALMVAQSASALDAVSLLIDGMIAAAKSSTFVTTEWRGCLLGNTALEFSVDDQDVITRIKSGVRILHDQFMAALRHPANGGIELSETEIDLNAWHLIAGIQGLLVLARAGLSEREIGAVRSAMILSLARIPKALETSQRTRRRAGK